MSSSSSDKIQKILLFGGSFNPPTKSHQKLFDYLFERKVIDSVWLLPCNDHADKSHLISFHHRVAMCQLLADKYLPNQVIVNDFESKVDTKGQTYPFLLKFLDQFRNPKREYFFLIGADNAKTIHTWDDADKLISLLPFIIFPRAGVEISESGMWYCEKPHLFLKDFASDDGSSTQVRRELKETRKSELLVSDLIDYILKHDLYK